MEEGRLSSVLPNLSPFNFRCVGEWGITDSTVHAIIYFGEIDVKIWPLGILIEYE